MEAPRKIAVAGATGRVGSHVVDVLAERGYDVVPISRSGGVDIVTKEGLAEALSGVDAIVDAATGPSPEEQPATEFFVAAARNLQEAGEVAGVQRIVVVSIIGAHRFSGGYGKAKVAHEQASLAGPIPVEILRAAQFHEFVQQMIDWGRQGEVAYVPRMRTQLVAARTVAEELAELAVGQAFAASAVEEIAGPREESLIEVAELFTQRRGEAVEVRLIRNSDDPNSAVYESGALLPGPGATIGGPTFAEWLDEAP